MTIFGLLIAMFSPSAAATSTQPSIANHVQVSIKAALVRELKKCKRMRNPTKRARCVRAARLKAATRLKAAANKARPTAPPAPGQIPQPTPTTPVTPPPFIPPSADTRPAGANLPITYDLASLRGTVRYVAPNGSDSAAGSFGSPFKTVAKAITASGTGDSVVIRGGTYSIADQGAVNVNKAGITISAYPGERPVFDGSIAAPLSSSLDGDLRYFSYQPVPAVVGEGLVLADLPPAQFSNGTATGLAADQGWRCVSGASYTTPVPVEGNPSGCTSPSSAYMISGYYPDQVWVGDRQLRQVLDKSRVVPGTFWLNRSAATDANPPVTNLYLSAQDAADMSAVRVSRSRGTFMQVTANNVTLTGLEIRDHSPAMNSFSLLVSGALTGVTLRDLAFVSNAGTAFKVTGSGGIAHATILDHLTITESSWEGAVIRGTDDLQLTSSVFSKSDAFNEFNETPQKGGIKIERSDRLSVVGSRFTDNVGTGIWFDQSNYEVLIANSYFANNRDSGVFYEISHGLTMVNNVILQQGARGPAIRIAGSSGVKLVNNTVMGGSDTIAVLTDPRSKNYNGRPCSEHPYRSGGAATYNADCNVGYSSDFDMLRQPSLTPGMTWRPRIDLMLNNVIADATGGDFCPGKTEMCAVAFSSYRGSTITNDPTSLFGVMDGNVYQNPVDNHVAKVRVNGAAAASGEMSVDNIDDLRGPNGFGSTTYSKTVETHGRYAVSGLVAADGTPTAALDALHMNAVAIPADTLINAYLPVGYRHYGAATQMR